MLRHKSNIYAQAIVALSGIPETHHRELTEGMLIIDDDDDIRVRIYADRKPTSCISLSVYRYGHYLDNRVDIVVCDDQINVYFLKDGNKLYSSEYKNYWNDSPSINVLYDILNDIMNHFGEPQLEKPTDDVVLKMIMNMETTHEVTKPSRRSIMWYGERYSDDTHEYRIVELGKNEYTKLSDLYGTDKLLSEEEWRSVGVQQSPGWEHIFSTDAGLIMIFRRPV